MDKILLNVDDVARTLSIGRTQVFELIRSGDLPSLKSRPPAARADERP